MKFANVPLAEVVKDSDLTPTARIARLIRSHGFDAYSVFPGFVEVIPVATVNGQRVECDPETIPATLAAAREWLGY